MNPGRKKLLTRRPPHAYLVHVPRVSISLPDELHRKAKELGLPISKLARDAVRGELDRLAKQQARQEAFEARMAEMDVEFGPPTPQEIAEADAWIERVFGQEKKKPKRRTA
jgi:post-segregation antitoxin (ccd killing protein)